MKRICFYFDVVSPYAYLAFAQLPQALMGISYCMTYRPVLLAAMLKFHGQLGPAEIGPKRAWTYRHVQWLAQQAGIELQLPARHPFNPLALLRLAVASGSDGACNRFVAQALFDHVWSQGCDAADAARLQQLTDRICPGRSPHDAAVKHELRANTDQAMAAGVFGVPMLQVDGRLFWGYDALPMLRAYLESDPWFQSPVWQRASQWPAGVRRSGGMQDPDAN